MQKKEKEGSFGYGKKEKIELMILGILVLAIFCYLLVGQKKEEKVLLASRPQRGTKKQELYLSAGDVRQRISLRINAREKTKEELEEAFCETQKKIREFLYADGSEPLQLTHSLELPSEIEETGAFLEWDSADETVINKKGEIFRGNITEQTKVMLRVRITIGEEKREEWYPVIVCPFSPEEAEYSLYRAEEYLKRLERETRGEGAFVIPEEVDGVLVQTETKKSKLPFLLVGGIMFLPVLLLMARRKEKEKRQKERERELLAVYPQFVTKLTLSIGAGLSLRSAWERLAAEYREKLKNNGRKEALYEEILVLAGELKNGTPEAKAYEAFGKRLAIRPYLRCTSLLIGQLEKGTGGLREKLELEVRIAWDKHRIMAEAKGEEAQTKLLFPMMGMLFLVFAIVMIPAFFQMGI